LALGNEFLVSAVDVFSEQSNSANATARDGRSVVVWTQRNASGNNDLHARLYNNNGSVFRDVILRDGVDNSADPAIAMDDHGEFVVTWTEAGNVKARMFFADGSPRTATFTVAGNPETESDPDVATDAQGNFVISYTYFGPNGSDIRAARYNEFGNFQQFITVAIVAANDERESSVAMSHDGRFNVAYTSDPQGTTNPNVRMQRYSNTGTLLGSTVPVAMGNGTERDPDVAMDDFGNAVVVYESGFGDDTHVIARRVSNTGALGDEVRIANFFNVDSTNPVVAMTRDGSGYVVAYDAFRKTSGQRNVRVTEMRKGADGFDRFVAEHNDNFVGDRDPAISMDGEGDFLVTYTRLVGSDNDIYGRRKRFG
jgi:hypothetical protein